MYTNEKKPIKMNTMVKSISTAWISLFVMASAYAQVGVGTEGAPVASAQLEVRSTTKGFLPPRMTTEQRNAISNGPGGAAAGLVVYNTTISQLEYYNGTSWSPLVTGNTPYYAQFRGNAGQTFTIAGQKVDFPTTMINVGGFTLNSNNTIVLPAGRIYRIDLNLGWAWLTWARFAVYNAVTNTAISPTAHLEGAESGPYWGSGTVTTFVNTTPGSISIDVRYVTGTGNPFNNSVLINDTGNGTNYASITIQTVD